MNADKRTMYDVAITFASPEPHYAAALFRRLSARHEVFFDHASPVDSSRPLDELERIYESSALIAVIASKSYASRTFPECECKTVIDRLVGGALDRVLLIRTEDGAFPDSITSQLNARGHQDCLELPSSGWELSLDDAARRVREKLERFARQNPDHPWSKSPPFSSRRYSPGREAVVVECVRRHLPAFAPLLVGDLPSLTETKASLTDVEALQLAREYLKESLYSSASLRGYIEQVQRANDFIAALYDLSSCTKDTGDNPQRRLGNARSAVKVVLNVLRSEEENRWSLSKSEAWRVPDAAELIQRLRHYVLRHLYRKDYRKADHPIADFIASIETLLFHPESPGPGGVQSLIEDISNDAQHAAEALQEYLRARPESRHLVSRVQGSSAIALRCSAIEAILEREDMNSDLG